MNKQILRWLAVASCALWTLFADGVSLEIRHAAADRGVASTWETPEQDKGAGIIGLKLGAFLPQAFSPLGVSYFAEVEGGYLLPFFNRMFSITGSVAVSTPITSNTLMESRVPGGSYSYTQTTQQFVLGLTFSVKIPLGRFVPYIGIGPRLFIVRTPSSGTAADGTAIPESVEISQEPGVGVPLGLDFLLGPGRLFAEVQLIWAASSQTSTGPGAFGSMTANVGYRFAL